MEVVHCYSTSEIQVIQTKLDERTINPEGNVTTGRSRVAESYWSFLVNTRQNCQRSEKIESGECLQLSSLIRHIEIPLRITIIDEAENGILKWIILNFHVTDHTETKGNIGKQC
ncbi:hypothetical protein Trydic_g16236 [Trypoxylus dichotomus]